MSSVAADEALYRRTAELFLDHLAIGRQSATKGLEAAGELLLLTAKRWETLDAEWEAQHDWLILGVPLSDVPRPLVRASATLPRTVPVQTPRRLGAAARHREAMTVQCPYCLVPVGKKCITMSGKRSPRPHMQRARLTYLRKK